MLDNIWPSFIGASIGTVIALLFTIRFVKRNCPQCGTPLPKQGFFKPRKATKCPNPKCGIDIDPRGRLPIG